MTSVPGELPSAEPSTIADRVALKPAVPRWSATDVAILIGVLIIAAAARYILLDQPPDYDELWHLGLTTGHGSPIGQIEPDKLYLDPPRQTSLQGAPPFWTIWNHMDGVLHPPLYVLTLRLWRDVFGEGDLPAAAYSIAWSLVAIGFCYATARLASDRVSAMFVALAMAAARTQIYFAQSIRGYEMLIGLGSIALWLMVLIEMRGPTRRRVIALAAMTLPLLLTHYFAAGAAVAMATYGLWRGRGHRAAFASTLFGCGVIYAVAWLPFAIRQTHSLQSGDMFLHVDSIDLMAELRNVLGAPMRLVIESAQTAGIGLATSIGVLLLIIASVILRWNRAIVPAAMWVAGCLLLIAALDFSRHTQHASYIRYFAIAAPGIFPMFAMMRSGSSRTFNRITASLLLLIAVFVRPEGNVVVTHTPGFSQVARWMSNSGDILPGEAILIDHGSVAADYGDNVYIHLSHEASLFPRPVIKVDSPLTDELRSRLPRHGWLVAVSADPELISKTFPGVKLSQPRVFGPEGVVLFYMDLHPPATTAASGPSSLPTTVRQ